MCVSVMGTSTRILKVIDPLNVRAVQQTVQRHASLQQQTRRTKHRADAQRKQRIAHRKTGTATRQHSRCALTAHNQRLLRVIQVRNNPGNRQRLLTGKQMIRARTLQRLLKNTPAGGESQTGE